MMKCPHCNGAHTLSQCPTWRGIYGGQIPETHRLVPVALMPAIEEALRRFTYFPLAAWVETIAAFDRVQLAPERSVGHTLDEDFEHFLSYSNLSNEPVATLAKLRLAYAANWNTGAAPFCDLHKMPLARCGCMPTDDGPGQPGAVETEKEGTEDANAK